MSKYTQVQINNFSIAGTMLDRRRKLTNKQRQEVAFLYRNRAELHLTTNDIGKMYSIYPGNCHRYANYDAWLRKQNGWSQKYQSKLDKETLSDIRKQCHKKVVAYKTDLLDVVEKHKRTV